MKEKIFTPNFTTKSSGSGLGLAMVSNIMNSFGGKIWFESEKDKGSTFYVEFLKTE
jgi:signal transduction histidine kinase